MLDVSANEIRLKAYLVHNEKMFSFFLLKIRDSYMFWNSVVRNSNHLGDAILISTHQIRFEKILINYHQTCSMSILQF